MRGLKSTLVLLAVLAGLVAYIYLVDAERPAGGEDAKEKPFSVTADAIEEVQIKSSGGEVTRARKAEKGWQVVDPIEADADPSELSSVTTNLASLEIQRVVDENAADLKQYGLDPARIEVGFRAKGDKDMRRLHIGEKTPAGGDVYARLPGGNKVFLISSFLENTFDRSAFDLRNKAILQFERDKADSLEIVNGGTTLQFVRSGSDWRIAKPIAARGDYGAIEGLVTRLSSGQMQKMVAPDAADLKQYGLDAPSLTASVGTGSSRATLLLGRDEGEAAYAKDAARPMVFTVENSLASDLRKDVGEFRRKDIFDFRSFTAAKVEVARGSERFVFEKVKDKDGKESWKNASGAAVDSAKVEDLLTKLSNLRAQAFDGPASAVDGSPLMTVTATFDEGRTEVVTFGKSGADAFARRGDEPGAARLETAGFDDAVKALDALK